MTLSNTEIAVVNALTRTALNILVAVYNRTDSARSLPHYSKEALCTAIDSLELVLREVK